MTVRGKYKEDDICVFGPRGGRYTLLEWSRKRGEETEVSDDPVLQPEINLMVNLPDKHNVNKCDVRPKVKHQDIIILQPLLAYVHYSLQNGTTENVSRAINSYFTEVDIDEAKQVLFDRCDPLIIGPIKYRRDGDSRSKMEANVKDILSAMNKLDKASNMPTFAIPSYQLHSIPRARPEELNSISVIERLNQLEDKWFKCQELIDKSVCHNIAMEDRVDKLEISCRPSYASITRGTEQGPQTPFPDAPIQSNAQPTIPSSFRVDPRHNVKGINSGMRHGAGQVTPHVRQVGTHHEALRPPELSIHKAGSIDNIDSISVRSAMSGASGYQYQKHYRKKLDKQHTKKTRTITGKNASDVSSSAFRGAPEPDRFLFIYRVEKDASESDIMNYLGENNILYRNVKCLSNPDSKFKSFKLTVAVSQYKALFDDNLWPNGVRVRPYRAPNVQRSSDY